MSFSPGQAPNSDNSVARKGSLEPGSVSAHMANEINKKLDEMGVGPKINLDAIAEAAKIPNTPNGISESLQSLLAKENKGTHSAINIEL